MKSTTYHFILDNETRVDLASISAAQAMQRCLEQNPARKIVKCWAGSYHETISYTKDGRRVVTPPGYIEYDVPQHEPYIKLPKKKFIDPTPLMFSEKEINGAPND